MDTIRNVIRRLLRPLEARGESSARRGEVWFIVSLALLGVCGVVLEWLVTRWGIGLSPDSATYIAGARGLLEGHGVAFPFGGGRWYPTTAWPPFYSIVLSVPGWVGVDLLAGARWINAVLLGANAIVVGLLLRRALGESHLVPLAGAALFLFSSDALSAHGWAWSDPLFIFLGFLGLLFLDIYLEAFRRSALVISAILLGLCAYSRYAGAAFILTGAVVMAMASPGRRGWRAKIGDLLLFGGLACLPVAGWFLRNFQITGFLGGSPAVFNPIPDRDWQAVYRMASLWLVPGRIGSPTRDWLMAALAGLFLVLTAVAIGRGGRDEEMAAGRRSRLGGTLVVFILAYASFLVGTRMYIRLFNIRDARYYLPLFLALIVLWLIDLHWLYQKGVASLQRRKPAWTRVGRRIGQGVAGIAFITVASFHGVQAAKWGRESYAEGLGYSNVSWHSSGILEYVRQLSEDTPVLSNAYDAIYVLTGREAYPLPREKEGEVGPTGPTSPEEWATTIRLLTNEGASLVEYRRATRMGMVSARRIGRETPLCPIVELPEGRVYVWCGAEETGSAIGAGAGATAAGRADVDVGARLGGEPMDRGFGS